MPDTYRLIFDKAQLKKHPPSQRVPPAVLIEQRLGRFGWRREATPHDASALVFIKRTEESQVVRDLQRNPALARRAFLTRETLEQQAQGLLLQGGALVPYGPPFNRTIMPPVQG